MEPESLVTNTLKGWEDPMAVLKQSGAKVSGFGDLTLDHYSQQIRLSIEAHLKDKYLRAHILRKEDEAGITIIIKYSDEQQLKRVLDAFLSHQDTVNTKNFRELVADIMSSGAEVLAETPDGMRSLAS